MPDFLVSAATGALSPVLNKLAALLGDEYTRFKGVRREVKFLIQELEAMHAFLLKKSEEENPDAQDKAWMKEVRELSYDIEDSLDDFRVRVGDDSTKPDSFIDKCKKLLKLDKTKARRRIAKEFEKLKGQVKEVSERNQRYKICETIMDTSKVTIDPRALAIFEDASRLVGIDGPKQELISFLTKDDGGISLQQPKIVSIVGIGGLGKTTLANKVYEELKYKFDCRAFLSVSRNPDMFKILRTILSEVTERPYFETEAGSIQQLIKKISEFLRLKRYLIVVDDVWDVETWETIKYALSDNSCGSVIITTTRVHDVAKACCSLYSGGWVYKLKPLQKQDSKRLFQNRIFGIRNESPKNLEEVSNKILKKCGGLPLAIIAISGLLANKARNGVHLVTEWDQVQTSIGHGLERDSTVEGMMGILSLSYFDLPSHLKACLLYLSTFPEDYEIRKDHLVRLWVAEGFVCAESTCTLYESGEKSFNELINRNLILPEKINEWTGEVDSCRLHDTILDFIVCKSTEDNFVTIYGIPRLTPPPPRMKVRRLSLQGETERGDATLDPNQNYANVRSIISFGPACSLLGLRFLRVLDFTGTLLKNHHLANIGELLQLRYLGLEVTELPEQIGALQNLETLDIRGNARIQLPTTIVGLKRLVNLLMWPRKLKFFPSGIKNMQALEELRSIKIDIKAAATFVDEIGDLTKMRHLGISFFSDSGCMDKESSVDLIEKMVSSFQRLSNLQTLVVQLNHDYYFEDDIIFDRHYIILEVPWCSATLRKLVFDMIPMSRVPSWMKSLVNIEELYMRIKKLDQESLCILGDLPVLVDLTLLIVNNVEGILWTDKRLVVSKRYGYRSLRVFRVHAKSLGSRPGIPMLTFEAGSMSKLEVLFITFDADITICLSNGHLDFGLKHLSQLTEVRCDMFGTELSILRVEAAIQRELDNHPKLPHFRKLHNPSTAAVGVPIDLYFTIHLGYRGVPKRRLWAAPATSDVRGPQFIAAPQQQGPLTVDYLGKRRKITLISDFGEISGSPCFTSSSGSPPNAEAERQAMDSYEPSQHDGPANDFSNAFNSLSLRDDIPGSSATAVEAASSDTGDYKMSSSTMDDNTGQSLTAALPLPTDLSFTIQHHGTSPDLSRRHRQQCRPSKARQGATISGQELVQSAPLIPDRVNGASGAAPTSDVLGPQLIAAPQQHGAFVPPSFTFSSGSPSNTETEQQAMDCYKPSQHDALANAFSSAFDGLSLGSDHPGLNATSVDAASSDTETQTTRLFVGSSSCQEGGRQQQQ